VRSGLSEVFVIQWLANQLPGLTTGTDRASSTGASSHLARQLEGTMVKLSTMIGILALVVAAPLGAQRPDRDRGSDDIPAGHRPPPGMCRVWVDGVPPGQQPAPTDCRTAIRNRPRNGRVIFGDDYVKSAREEKNKLPELLKELRRKKDDSDRKDDEKQSDKRKRYRKP
jgi:hypothetical protein